MTWVPVGQDGGAARKWAALVLRRGARGQQQEFSLARLATHICEPPANEGCSARSYCGFPGAQEFGDDTTVRAAGSKQTAPGGVRAWSKCHHNCHRRKWVGGGVARNLLCSNHVRGVAQ